MDSQEFMNIMAASLAPYMQQQKGLGVEYKHTTPSGTPSTPYYHGPGGLFGVAGLERDVLSSRIKPTGLAGSLPVMLSTYMNPLFAYISGFKDVTGSNPTGVCDDGQVAGPMKNCLQTAQFGRYTFMTRELERNRVGQKIDRGEFFDLNIVNDPLTSGLESITPSTVAGSVDLNKEILMRFVEVGVAFQNKLVRQLYEGNPANGNGAGYKEFPALDILIGTGKVDALTNTACPSLDSLIRNFNYGLVGTADIVAELTYDLRYLKRNADKMGFQGTQWVITMREELFYEITAVWPCSYLTYRCSFRTNDGTQITNVSAADQIAMRDAMRAGKYLLVDGIQWPVMVDDGIVEEDEGDAGPINSGQYASDIYVIPLRSNNMNLTFWEFFDYGGGSMEQVGPNREDFWTDDGKFMWHHKPPQNWCEQWIAKCEPRVRLVAPQLAARLQNVRYQPLFHMRDALPTATYFTNGGVSTARSGPSYYKEWTNP